MVDFMCAQPQQLEQGGGGVYVCTQHFFGQMVPHLARKISPENGFCMYILTPPSWLRVEEGYVVQQSELEECIN